MGMESRNAYRLIQTTREVPSGSPPLTIRPRDYLGGRVDKCGFGIYGFENPVNFQVVSSGWQIDLLSGVNTSRDQLVRGPKVCFFLNNPI
jgi:hypothetical protein